MAEKILLFEADVDFNALTKKAAESQKSIEELKDQSTLLKKSIKDGNKEIESYSKSLAGLRKEGKANSKEYKDQEKSLKNLNKQQDSSRVKLETVGSTLRKNQLDYRILKKSTDAYNKSVTDQIGIVSKTDGSIKGLEAALASNNKAYRLLTKEQRDNDQIGGKLIKTIQSQDKEYKDLQRSIGTTAVDVGNYKGQMSELLKENSNLSKSFEQSIRQIPFVGNGLATAYKAAVLYASGQKAALAATTGTSKGLKLFRIALISTGVGAFVVALGSLIAFLATTQRGLDTLTKVTKPLQVIFQKTLGIVQDLGEDLFDAFSNPKQLLVDIGESIKTNLINRFKAVGVIVEGIKNLDFAQVSNGLLQAGTGVEDVIGKVTDLSNKAGDFFSESINQGMQLRDLSIEIEKAEANIVLQRAQSLDQIKELELIAKDTSKNSKQRNEAAEKAVELSKELAENEKNIINLKIKEEEITQSLNDSGRKDLQKLNELKAELIQKDSAQKAQELKFIGARSALAKEQAAKEKADAAELIEKQKERVESSIENLQKELELYRLKNKSILDSEKELTGELVAEEEARLQSIFDQQKAVLDLQKENKLISEIDYNISLLTLEQEYLESKKELSSEFTEYEKEQKILAKEEEALEYESKLEQARLRGENEFSIKLAQLEKERKAEVEDAKLKGKDINAIELRYAKKKEEIELQQSISQTESVRSTIGNITQIYGQFFGQSKKLNTAIALTDTYLAAQKAFLSQMTLSPDSPIRAGIAAAAATTIGLANVAQIQGIKFADGGLAEGNSHEQGGIPFSIAGRGGYEMEGGEYIVNKKSTSAFLPLLEHINSKHTDSRNFGINAFASGGAVGGIRTEQFDYERLSTQIANKTGYKFQKAVQSLPTPQVAVTEINEVSNRVNVIESGANIG